MADNRFDHRSGSSTRCWCAALKRGPDAQGLGRSRGGLSTKIHAAGDGLANPIRLIGTPGQRNDIAFAHDLIDGLTADVTIADKAMTPTILSTRSPKPAPKPSSRRNETAGSSAPNDIDLYKERNI